MYVLRGAGRELKSGRAGADVLDSGLTAGKYLWMVHGGLVDAIVMKLHLHRRLTLQFVESKPGEGVNIDLEE